MKKVLSFLLAALLLFALSVPAFADSSSVTYEGGAEKYVFLPGSDFSDTDLFQNFKGLMPGDTVSQDITVKSTLKGNYYVKIYLKAVPHVEGAKTVDEGKINDPVLDYDKTLRDAAQKVPTMEDFLHQLSMTVVMDGKEIYSASPDELGGLSDWVVLGYFFSGDEKTLTVNLSVPIELGNEYALRAGEVDWVFKAEEYPYTPDLSPRTGDTSNIVLFAGLMLAALIGISAIVFFLRKKKKQ